MIRTFLSAVLILILVQGCAWNASRNQPEKTSFVKASQGKAKGVYSWFTGSGNYCMLEIHNAAGIAVDRVAYVNGVCKIWWRTLDGKPVTILDPDAIPNDNP